MAILQLLIAVIGLSSEFPLFLAWRPRALAGPRTALEGAAP